MVPKGPKLRIIRIYPDGISSDNHNYLHSFWKVTLRRWQHIRFGSDPRSIWLWFEPATSWDECTKHHCHEPALLSRVGTARAFCQALDSCAHVRVAQEFPLQYLTLREWQRIVMHGVEENVAEYAQTSKLHAATMLCLPTEEFRVAENAYLRAFVTSLHTAVTQADGVWYERRLEVEATRQE